MLQPFQFWKVVVLDIRIVRMLREVVLVIILGLVKRRVGNKLRRDRTVIHFRRVDLRDVGFGNFLLFVTGVENG